MSNLYYICKQFMNKTLFISIIMKARQEKRERKEEEEKKKKDKKGRKDKRKEVCASIINNNGNNRDQCRGTSVGTLVDYCNIPFPG